MTGEAPIETIIEAKYTLGFVRCKDSILILNRLKAPWMGRWNGVCGKIDHGETPYDCMSEKQKKRQGLVVSIYFQEHDPMVS